MCWWRVENIVLLDGCRVDGETWADDPSHGCRGQQGWTRRCGDHGSGVTRRRVAARSRDARRCHWEVTVRPHAMRAGWWQEVETVDHGSASDGVVGTRHAKARSQWHTRVTVESKRVERTVGKEAVGGRLLVLVAVVAARTRRNGRRVTSSLGRCLRSCASGATRASSITTELMTMDGDKKSSRSRRVRIQGPMSGNSKTFFRSLPYGDGK